MGTPRIPPEFRFTEQILKDLSTVSLENAEQLIKEAKLLLSQGFLPRAYFLSVAAIEEIGKAYLCFESSVRNLNDSAITSKIIKSIENHSTKINAAFHTSILTSTDPRGAMQTAVDLMVALKNGREPSMYTDINYIDSKIYVPNSVIRDIAARDSVRLSEHCFSSTLNYIKNSDPTKKSKVDDAVFGLKSKTFSKIMENEDFWWYLIDCQENSKLNHNEIILKYDSEYFSKNKLFKASEAE
jgi:AbiV family abortive infection protein